MFLGFAARTQAATFTATSTGNWNDGATYGNTSPGVEGTDYPPTAGGDTVTINGQKTVTIPASYNARATVSALNAGVTGTHTKLIINGSLRLEGTTTTLNSYTELNLGAGATLDLDKREITIANIANVWFSWQGTSGSHATVKSTTVGGIFSAVNIAYLSNDWDYVDISDLGNSTFGSVNGTLSNTLNYVTMNNCGDISINGGDATHDISITNSDFRNPNGTNKYLLVLTALADPTTGLRQIATSTFSSTNISTSQVRLYSNNFTISNSVFEDTYIYTNATGQSVNNSFFHNDASSGYASFSFGGSPIFTLQDSYIYADGVNAHPLLLPAGGSTISRNVFEGLNGQTDFLFPGSASVTHTITNNLFLVAGSPVTNTSNANASNVSYKNNTAYVENNGTAGMMFYCENVTYGTSPTITLASNIIVDSNTATNDYGVRLYTTTADQVDYSDYNIWYGYPGGDVSDHYYQVAITEKTEGTSAGFGLYDKVVDPAFVVKTRTSATWGTSLEGAGTAANAITEMLKMNGYGGTFNLSYTPSNLVSYVRAGFASTNAALRGTGDPADGSPDIGAVAVSNTAPSVTFGSISSWNKGTSTINYTLTDADNDTCNISQVTSSGIEYSTDGSTWHDATKGTGGDGLTSLACASGGSAHTFVWDTTTDLATTEDSSVYIRIAPSDGGGGLSWATSSAFGVDNVAPSSVGAPTFGTIATSSIVIVKPSSVTENGSGLNQWQARRNSTTELGFNATSTASITDSSLSANTQYVYDVEFRDYATNTSSYGTSASKYTLAPTPTNLAGVAGLTTMDLSVDSFTNATASSSGYYFSRTGANSDWITTNSWSDSGLTCGTSYTYSVKYRNGDGIETSSASLTKSTSDCPATGSSGMPSSWYSSPQTPTGGFSALINNGSQTTNSNIVILSLKAGLDTVRMALSNTSDFAFANQETYTPTKAWNLCAGLLSCSSGTHNVYVKFFTSRGTASNAVSDSIILNSFNTSSFSFKKPLYRGLTNNDVKNLQTFLKTDSSIYPEGLITGYFGPLTQKAVQKFQIKYQIVNSMSPESDPGYGYVGPKTRAKLNELMGEAIKNYDTS